MSPIQQMIECIEHADFAEGGTELFPPGSPERAQIASRLGSIISEWLNEQIEAARDEGADDVTCVISDTLNKYRKEITQKIVEILKPAGYKDLKTLRDFARYGEFCKSVVENLEGEVEEICEEAANKITDALEKKQSPNGLSMEEETSHSS